MGKTVADREAGTRARLLVLIAVLAASLALAERAPAAGLVGADYLLNWDETVDRTDSGTTTTWTFNHSLDVKYRGFLSPVVENEITMKVTEQIKSEGKPRETLKVNPVITLKYKGSNWSAGAKRTIDDSNEPNKDVKIGDSYFIEVTGRPARATLPDLKGKYTLDKDFQADSSNLLRHGLAVSSVYRPLDWLNLRGDYRKNWTEDRLKPDSDTRDDGYTFAGGIRHMVSRKLKVNSEFKMENTTGATLLSAGGTTNEKHDQSYDWKNSLSFLPFVQTTVEGTYDWTQKQNRVTGQHDYQTNIRVALNQGITRHLDIRAEFSRAIAEPRHTADDNRKIDDSWSLDVIPKLSQLFGINLKWQKKDSKEVHFGDPTKDTTSGSVAWSASWSGTLMPFWKASASYDKTDTITREVTTAIDRRYSLKSTFSFTPINVILDPSYDIALKENRAVTPVLGTATRDFKVKIAWEALRTRNIQAKIDHSYGRKQDSALENIQRTDSTNLGITWTRPFPNWSFGISASRSATDTSGDDVPPDITATVDFKADYTFDRFSMGMGYKYDIKKAADNSEAVNFRWGWAAPRWDVAMTYSFSKTFSAELKEGYALGIAFKYSL